MSDFFSQLEEKEDRLIVRPQKERDKYKKYEKFKIGKAGWLWGYWSSSGCTRSGFYRDCLVYVGAEHRKSRIEQTSEREIVVHK